jgi:hypothetical protein
MVNPDWYDDLPAEWEPRPVGSPRLPFMRFDFGYQWVESDIDAYDYRGEIGYGPIALCYNQTRYQESGPADELDLIRVYGLYRMSFGPYLEVDVGLGKLTLDGNARDTRFSFTVPVRIHPSEYVAIEIRPAFSENIDDVDIGVLLTPRYLSLRAGYRWVSSPGASLNGPYAGASVHF